MKTEETVASKDEPFGKKATSWLASHHLKKAAEGRWKIGISVATEVLTEAAKKYYGLLINL